MSNFHFLIFQFSCSVMSNSLRPHELQHTRLPCPSSTPRAYSNSHPSSWWYHPTISSSVIVFSSCLQSFPASGSFPMTQFFKSGGQSITVSASASFLSMNIQDWFPLGLTGLISLQSKGVSRGFCSTIIWKHQFLGTQPFLWSNSHIHARLHDYLKNHSFDYMDVCWRSDVSAFEYAVRFVITFLPRTKNRDPFTVHHDFWAQENKICHFPFLFENH